MFQTISTIIVPVFIIVAFGYFSTIFGVTTNSAIDVLAKYAQNIALPALLFINISTLELGTVLKVNLLLSFYLSAIICFALGMLGGYCFVQKPFPMLY